ncbi:MAG: cyanophycinase [Spirochaetes bacterium]|nr:cyanophycinase [Spirochaetota bacterium]
MKKNLSNFKNNHSIKIIGIKTIKKSLIFLTLTLSLLLVSILYSCSNTITNTSSKNESYDTKASNYEPDPGNKPIGLIVYSTGNKKFIKRNPIGGFLIQGGGLDVDEAFLWLINRCDGGDFVVLRTNDSKGYNDWIYYDLKGVNSVHTLVVNSYTFANSSYVENVINNAEAIFIAGGDQYEYYKYWKGTKLESAIKRAYFERKVPIGGTSAGMVVLGHFDYIPYNNGVTSDEALQNPYHKNMDYIKNDFLENFEIFKNIIFDTHFYERKRMGRLITFMARIVTDYKINYNEIKAVACDEKTAICIDNNGIGKVFGYGYAFFLIGNRPIERCRSESPLDWYGNKQAVKCIRVKGTLSGSNTFDFKNWSSNYGETYYIWVDNGTLYPDRVY